MATGAPDANGIWIYGEDDSQPTFSALLNKLGASTSTQVGTLRQASPIQVANATARNAAFPAPVQGNTVFRNDLGVTEIYYEAYNSSTNPGGATSAGWYPNVPILFNKSVGSTNPIPNTTSDVGNSSQTLTIPEANMICEFEVTARVQMNIAMSVEVWINIDGTDIATTKVQSNSTGEMHIPLYYRTTAILGAGNRTIKLRLKASASNAAVFYDARWKVTLTPPTKPLGA